MSELLPASLPPVFLTREQAATYVGVSTDTFDAEVAAGLWPKPVRRGASGRRLTWFRPALDEAAARLADVPAPPRVGPPDPPTPAPSATELSAADRVIAERIARATKPDRSKHGQPKAA